MLVLVHWLEEFRVMYLKHESITHHILSDLKHKVITSFILGIYPKLFKAQGNGRVNVFFGRKSKCPQFDMISAYRTGLDDIPGHSKLQRTKYILYAEVEMIHRTEREQKHTSSCSCYPWLSYPWQLEDRDKTKRPK